MNSLHDGRRAWRARVCWILIGWLVGSGPVADAAAGASSRLPDRALNLRLAAPIRTWDEAVPLGNGTMGVLMWGEGRTLRFSLDRGDLWDERPSKAFLAVREQFHWAAMQRMVAENRMADFHRVYDSNYDYDGPPTKLPAGRLEITLGEGSTVEGFELDLATAVGKARLGGGGEVRAFVNAGDVKAPVALVRISGAVPEEFRLRSPESVKKLGYGPARTGEAEGLRWFEQEAAEGFAYAVCVGWKREAGGTLVAVTVATRGEGASPQAVAEARVRGALQAGEARWYADHARWWAEFWSRSRVVVPEAHILSHYHLVRYFYGSASRRGAPPMPLQGVWSADAGTLPPWKGDYHNDLNTQMTYLAYRTSGDFDEGATFLDFLWDLLPEFRRFAKEFYGAPGAAVPGVMSLAGQPLGGWGQYSLSPTMGAWNAHLFYLHWRHTADARFLKERAYPFCRELAVCLESLLKPDADGVLKLPLSSSPEIFDNTRKAFLEPNTNYDLASLRMLFLALAEIAEAAGSAGDAGHWRDLDRRLGDWHVSTGGAGAPVPADTLLLDRTTALPASHRHLSNLMPLHPFNLITAEGGDRDRRIIAASLRDWDGKGTAQWCGYSFSWMSCLRARVGDAEAALRNLDIYARAFVLRNGFHANGDQTKSGYSSMTYRPFTLEGNFLAMDAVHEMLLQSWHERPGRAAAGWGTVRVFPAMPWRWHDAEFEDLRAEGGHRVSARRENNATTWLRIVAGDDGPVRVRDNFGGREPRWSRSGVRKVDGNFELPARRGEVWEATLPRPESWPAAPTNAAVPVTVTMTVKGEAVPDAGRAMWDVGNGMPEAGGAMLDLRGTWRVRLDPEDAGRERGWPSTPLVTGDEIALPGTTDLAGLGAALDTNRMVHATAFPVTTRFPGVKEPDRADEHGYLVRKHLHVGPAWYEREIRIPEAWRGRSVALRIERAMWRTEVWVDGRAAGAEDSLVAEHRHVLGVLEPGHHRLTVRVDNRMIHNLSTITHAYGPETQSRWNGMIGELRLEAASGGPVSVREVRVSPAADRRSVRVEAALVNGTGREARATLRLRLFTEHGTEVLAERTGDVVRAPGMGWQDWLLELPGAAEAWDEFHPVRHRVEVTVRDGERESDPQRVLFGFRHVERAGRDMRVNGRRVFLRGTLDCAVYPRTGHPPMTVPEWERVFGVVKEYGFNHVRFHTWCPPEAAFEAADRLGLYLQAEAPAWIDDWGISTVTRPAGIGKDAAVTAFLGDELRRMSAAYGNHPSFLLCAIGNEFGMRNTDWERVNAMVEEIRAFDPRRLYAGCGARKNLAADEFWFTHQTGAGTRGVGGATTDWDFEKAAGSSPVPVLAHETGQRPVFPDYDALLPKFTGPLAPWNYERLRRSLVESGMNGQTKQFARASARFQLVQYKAEHEAMRRTRGYTGYQLLMLNDFTGQSEALVGILDPFWESKGAVSAAEVRAWNAPTVLLARFPKYTWTSDETFSARLEVAHHGPADLPAGPVRWSLIERGGAEVARGEVASGPIPTGDVTALGEVRVEPGGWTEARALEFVVRRGDVENRWGVWVYPARDEDREPAGVLVTRELGEPARQALEGGGRVLYLAHGLTNAFAARTGFESVYWSAGWWGNRFSSLGVLCDPRHPALAGFPNEGWSDWPWRELCAGATTFDLTGAPAGLRAIVQPVPDFHFNTRLGQVVEVRVGRGSLLVCGYDLESGLEKRPAARQLRRSLGRYVAGTGFVPELDVTWEWARERWGR